jgi:DNA-binding SARP family transcriptional activator/class 3 adenylate cyclase
MTTVLRISTFGAFDVRLGDRRVAGVSNGKMSALLVYLAMTAGHRHRREALAELFWPGLPAEAARSNLRHTVFHLRQALHGAAAQYVRPGRDWLGFDRDAPYRLDALELTAPVPSCIAHPTPEHCGPCIAQMEAMVALYRGRFMAELALPECPEFDGWLQLQADALHRHALALLERLSDCHEQFHGYARALHFAQRHVELEPWDEEGHRRVVRLFALNGQRGAALAHYEACCRILRDGPGVPPGERLRALAAHIRAGTFAPGTTPGGARPPAACLPPPPFVPPLSSERRYATVVYCEITAVDIDDPDAAMALLRVPRLRAAAIVRHHGGDIVPTHGGGLLAYFARHGEESGAAVQAVAAARLLARENAPGLDVRVGVHSGVVVAGADPGVPDLVGTVSNLAIRLRLVAEPGEVVLSGETKAHVATCHECIPLGTRRLRGMSRAVEAFRLGGPSASAAASRAPTSSPDAFFD